MSLFFQGLLEKLLAVFARAVELWAAYAAGRRSQKSEQVEEEAKIKDDQARIAAERPVDRDDLVRRLRDNGL